MKLKNHPYSNCSVRVLLDGSIVFTSYNTDVIYIDKDGWLYVSGLYSATTRKQIGYFLKEYVPFLSFQDIKSLYCNKCLLNIYTAEIKGEKAMNKKEILENIRILAASQGFYGRLYQSIMESNEKENILQYLENQNFTDAIDLILFLES